MFRLLDRLTRAAEARIWTPALAVSAPAWVAALRMLGERYLAFGDRPLARPQLPWFLHTFAFYLALLCVLGALLARLVPVDWRRAQNLVGMGLLLGVLPPLVDCGVLGRNRFAYEYHSGSGGLPWLLSGAPTVLPPGETTVLWASIVMIGAYAWRRSSSPLRGVATAVATWFLVLVFLVLQVRLTGWASAATGLAPSEWRALWLAAMAQVGVVVGARAGRRWLERLPQVLLPVLFVVLGAALRGRLDGAALLVAGHFTLVGTGFALANDWYDRAEDQARGRTSPVDAGVAALVALIPLTGAASLLATRVEAGLCLVAFAVVSHAYHADPLRLKCVFPLSYKTEGLLAGLALLAGLVADTSRLPVAAELWVALAVGLGTPAALVFKDYKDVDGDAAAGVQTAFVFAEARGWARRRVLAVAVALLLVSLAVPLLWLSAQGVGASWLVGLGLLATLGAAALWWAPKADGAVRAALLCAEAFLGLSAAALMLR
jgi:4-hydroxybenzoate polyprenyltransferase